ncbi:MAG: hypothetical protein WCI73_16835, partial [Phycisphaerae bacterium]
FKMGAVRASVFCNVIEREGRTVPLRKVVLEVRYRDKDGQWQGTNSLSVNDLPKAVTALQQAYEYLLSEHVSGAMSPTVPELQEATVPATASNPPYYPRPLGSKRF